MTRATQRYVRGSGYQPDVAFTPWQSVGQGHISYESAKKALDAAPLTGLRQWAIFYKGKPYTRRCNSDGFVLEEVSGAGALRRWG